MAPPQEEAEAGPLSERTRGALLRGAALYDAGLYWESHEAWEEAWLEEDGAARLLLQGLIQVAAGYHKAVVQRQPRGCVKLLGSGLAKLRAVPEGLGGVPLARFVPEVEATLAAAQRWLAGGVFGLEASELPRLRLS